MISNKKECTFSIIKPNAVKKNVIGMIHARLERAGLKIIAIKMLHLDRKSAEDFYVEHKKKYFFSELIEFMISGPIVLQVLTGYDAIRCYRDLIGAAVDPVNALPGTLRADYADNSIANAVHGSDSPESAKREISFFFTKKEIFDR